MEPSKPAIASHIPYVNLDTAMTQDSNDAKHTEFTDMMF